MKDLDGVRTYEGDQWSDGQMKEMDGVTDR